jgi:hypothetical protein
MAVGGGGNLGKYQYQETIHAIMAGTQLHYMVEKRSIFHNWQYNSKLVLNSVFHLLKDIAMIGLSKVHVLDSTHTYMKP